MCSYVQEAYHAKKGIHQLDLNVLNGEQASHVSEAWVSLPFSLPCLRLHIKALISVCCATFSRQTLISGQL